jgi:very-short-patch-repair endonuclease
VPVLEQTRDLDATRPFTVAAAQQAGITPAELRRRHYRRVLGGVYVDAAVPETPALRTAAALALHPPGAFASHFSAARLWQLPVPTERAEDISVLHPNERRRRTGVRCHVAPTESQISQVDGLRASVPEQLFVELAQYLTLVDLVVLGDAILGRRLSTMSALRNSASRRGRRHTIRAREAARYVRRGVDSPMETRLRMLIVLAGLPEPKVNVRLRDERGLVVVQFDLCYPSIKLVVQYDGRHHADDDQWDEDIHRREAMDEHGWRVLIVNSRGIYNEPGRTLERIHRALRMCNFPGTPRDLRTEWRAHFRVQKR